MSIVECPTCLEATKKECLEKIKVKKCKPGQICMGAKGLAFVLQCASRDYITQSEEDCADGSCMVATCWGSLCVPDIFN